MMPHLAAVGVWLATSGLVFGLGMLAQWLRHRPACSAAADDAYDAGWDDGRADIGRHLAAEQRQAPPPPPPHREPLAITTGELRAMTGQLQADLAAIHDWGSAVAMSLLNWSLDQATEGDRPAELAELTTAD